MRLPRCGLGWPRVLRAIQRVPATARACWRLLIRRHQTDLVCGWPDTRRGRSAPAGLWIAIRSLVRFRKGTFADGKPVAADAKAIPHGVSNPPSETSWPVSGNDGKWKQIRPIADEPGDVADAPEVAVRGLVIEPRESTHNGHSVQSTVTARPAPKETLMARLGNGPIECRAVCWLTGRFPRKRKSLAKHTVAADRLP